jgi:tellurite resistance protein
MALRQQGAVLAPRCHGDSSRLPALQQVPLARAALHIMYMVAAIDNDPAKVEFDRIAKIAETLPLFEKCNQGMLDQAAQECAAMVQVGAEGYERLFAIFELSVPPDVWEAVFALACDVAYGDERLRQQENKCLHVLSAEFGISADVAQMHRQSAQARYATP